MVDIIKQRADARRRAKHCAICKNKHSRVLCDTCRADPANADWLEEPAEEKLVDDIDAVADAHATDDGARQRSGEDGVAVALHNTEAQSSAPAREQSPKRVVIAKKLRAERRAERRFTDREIADAVGCSPQHVGQERRLFGRDPLSLIASSRAARRRTRESTNDVAKLERFIRGAWQAYKDGCAYSTAPIHEGEPPRKWVEKEIGFGLDEAPSLHKTVVMLAAFVIVPMLLIELAREGQSPSPAAELAAAVRSAESGIAPLARRYGLERRNVVGSVSIAPEVKRYRPMVEGERAATTA